MAIVRWTPRRYGLSSWPNILDDDIFPAMQDAAGGGLDVYETQNQVVVKANLAGVPEDEIDLTFERGVLYINAELEEEEENEDRTYYSRANRSFSYRVNVPGDIDYAKEPEAEMDNGVLTVTFTKSQQAMPKKLQIKRKK